MVKAAAAFTTSIGFENGYCTLSYCKWYSFHKSIAALDRVSMVTVMQNPFQKISHTCAVRVYTNSESTDYHTVKGLNYDKVIKLLNRNGYAVWKNEEWGISIADQSYPLSTELSDFAAVELWCRGWRPRQPDIEAAKLGIFTNEKKQTMLWIVAPNFVRITQARTGK